MRLSRRTLRLIAFLTEETGCEILAEKIRTRGVQVWYTRHSRGDGFRYEQP